MFLDLMIGNLCNLLDFLIELILSNLPSAEAFCNCFLVYGSRFCDLQHVVEYDLRFRSAA